MIGNVAIALFLSGLAWLAGIARGRVADMLKAAKQNVAALEPKPGSGADKAQKVAVALVPMLPDQYEGPATQVVKILIEAAVILTRLKQ